MKFISVPTEIEAVQYVNGESINDLILFMGKDSETLLDLNFFPNIKVKDKLQKNQPIPVNMGDWIIRGTKGEYYPCDDEVFKAKYRPVEE